MATQDYVRRGRPKKQVRKTGKRKAKPKKHPLPWLRISAASIVLATFAYGLYWLQNEDSIGEVQLADVSASNIAAESSIVSTNDEKGLPVLKEEEWAFIDSLPEYSVEVDVEDLPESDKDYIMQCGSFRKISQAESLKAQIAFQGLEAEVIESNGSNGRWYRVVLGPYERKRLAESHRHQLRRENVVGCRIW